MCVDKLLNATTRLSNWISRVCLNPNFGSVRQSRILTHEGSTWYISQHNWSSIWKNTTNNFVIFVGILIQNLRWIHLKNNSCYLTRSKCHRTNTQKEKWHLRGAHQPVGLKKHNSSHRVLVSAVDDSAWREADRLARRFFQWSTHFKR